MRDAWWNRLNSICGIWHNCELKLERAHFALLPYKHMGKLLTSRIFIKSAIDQTSLKLGVMITWVNSNTLKMFTAIATSLDSFDFLFMAMFVWLELSCYESH